LRYNDLEFIRKDGVLSLLVSYTQFDPDKVCFTNRLAIRELEEGWNAPVAENAAGITDGWKVVFETQPCLPFNEGPKRNASIGHQAGGRLALAADGSIYLTSGDFEFDGMKEGSVHPQNTDSDYGKIFRIDPKVRAASNVIPARTLLVLPRSSVSQSPRSQAWTTQPRFRAKKKSGQRRTCAPFSEIRRISHRARQCRTRLCPKTKLKTSSRI
jgi:hypothetical protein